ncbi:MAG: hypothetical protein QOF61_1818 [Acidobacteriota bacterium]|jgi:hypothetical protein|nr:hypothetical protein [Acidobacteriota bacterium]
MLAALTPGRGAAQTPQPKTQTTGSATDRQSRATATKDKPPPRRPVEIENLVNDARTVRAEFDADVLIRLAGSSNLVADRTWKRELLEEAFRAAGGASQPVRLYSYDGQVDTRPGYLTRALALLMDAMSLRLRVVAALMKIDKRRARELFAEMPPKLPLPRVECEDALVADVSEFYDMLTRVAREAFTPAERSRDEDVRFVETYVDNITSPAQVRPVVEVIAAVGDTPARVETLTRAYAKVLRNLNGDDRTFTAYLDNSAGGIRLLGAKSAEHGVAADQLLASARDYFTRHLTAVRCADNVRRAARSAELFKSLDEILSEPAPDAREPQHATFAELRPARVAGEMQVFRHWQTPAGARLLFKIKELRFGAGAVGAPLSDADRRTPQWEARLLEFRNELADWDERTEATAEDYFHQKCVLYWALLELVPPGAAQDQVLADYVAFLRKPTVQQDSPLEWFMHVKDLLDLTRRTAPETPPKRAKLLDALRDSGDPVLRLYSNLERLLPPPAPQPPPKIVAAPPESK